MRAIIMLAVALAGAAPATALTQSWGGYRWARTGPLVITLGDNVGTAWDGYLATAAADWSQADAIDFVPAAGTSSARTCGATYGTVQVCDANYGRTGWLGLASVWATGDHRIVQATVKLNDYYFAKGTYATAAFRAFVTCQEIGHTLGLAHTNEVFTNANTGSCMDYTNDPSGTRGTNGTLANTHPDSVDFAALADNYAVLDATQLAATRPRTVATHAFAVEGAGEDESVRSLPEPASWALMVTGFGMIGVNARRRTVAL